jgi:hypothetical protein
MQRTTGRLIDHLRPQARPTDFQLRLTHTLQAHAIAQGQS